MKTYKMSPEELVKLTKAMHDPTLVDMHNRPLVPAQERCNQVWKQIAAARGLDWESIRPAPGKGAEYFTAEELPATKEEENEVSS